MPQLYQRNAFRVTGLPVKATGRAVRDRRQKADTYFEAGIDFPRDGDLPLPCPSAPAVVRSAFEVLGDARRRLVDEVLWLWGDPDGQCSCAPAVHAAHDAAVRSHALVLDSELAGGATAEAFKEQWATSARFWEELIHGGYLWAHVRERVRRLDDRRLGPSVVRTLRAELSRTLVAPGVHLVERTETDLDLRVRLCRMWSGVGGYVLEDMLDDVARPLFDDLAARLAEVGKEIEAGHDARVARSVLRGDVLPKLNRLAAFWGPESGRRLTAGQRFDALSDSAAVLLSNSTVHLVESQLKAGASPLTIHRDELVGDLRRALGHATRRETRQGIEDVLRQVRRIPTREQYLAQAVRYAGQARYDDYSPHPDDPASAPRRGPLAPARDLGYGVAACAAALVAGLATFLSLYSGSGVLFPAGTAVVVMAAVGRVVARIRTRWPG